MWYNVECLNDTRGQWIQTLWRHQWRHEI